MEKPLIKRGIFLHYLHGWFMTSHHFFPWLYLWFHYPDYLLWTAHNCTINLTSRPLPCIQEKSLHSGVWIRLLYVRVESLLDRKAKCVAHMHVCMSDTWLRTSSDSSKFCMVTVGDSNFRTVEHDLTVSRSSPLKHFVTNEECPSSYLTSLQFSDLFCCILRHAARGHTVAWLRHCATSWKAAGSIPDEVIRFFHLPHLSSLNMALGSTQPLTEMTICEPTV
jgi:hypothetical protein